MDREASVRARAGSFVPVVGLAVAVLFSFPSDALPRRPRTIEVGPVSTSAPAAGPSAVTALRRTLEGAAQTMDSRAASLPRTLVLGGAVTRLDHERVGGRLRLSCEVSLFVSERPGGQMRALLTGRAVTEGQAPRSAAELRGLQEGLVCTAAESALERLPAVIAAI